MFNNLFKRAVVESCHHLSRVSGEFNGVWWWLSLEVGAFTEGLKRAEKAANDAGHAIRRFVWAYNGSTCQAPPTTPNYYKRRNQ